MEKSMRMMTDMKTLGFSEYECKAYLKLLEKFPLNGYALSKASGIPRSRIYEVLKNLIDKQMVFEQADEKTRVYYPMEPKIFIQKLKAHYAKLFDDLSEYASTLYREPKQDDKLVVISGRENIVSFLKLLINGARERVAVSIWEEEITELTGELDAALDRGVMLRGVYFGKKPAYTCLTPHRRIDRYMAEKKERYLSIIIDHTHAISGIMSRGSNAKVTWTRDEGFISVSEDYIAHDLLVNLYSASLDPDTYKKFEAFADNVHDHYFHYSKKDMDTYKRLI